MNCGHPWCEYCRHYSKLFDICLIEFQIEIFEMLREKRQKRIR